ncbi:MAG: hypothetical protein ABI442_13980 [Gemmatimonadaceae bacterium]
MNPSGSPASRSSRKAAIGWGLGFGFLCLMMVVIGLESALHFIGPAIDGPFQLYNSLRRIWAGQTPGVDFQFFHGLGIPYLHYLPFRLLGGTFFASEIVRELTSALLFPIVVIVVLRFFIRDWTRTMAWAAIAMTVSIGLRLTSMLVAINSLLGVRATIPTLIPVALCLRTKPWIRTTITGVMLGLSLLMGTEQGLAVALAIILALVVYVWRSPKEARVALVGEGSVILALGAAVLVALLVTLGGVAGMRGALNYNFRLVPMDQYWYFGAPPNLFLSSWGAIPGMMAKLLKIPLSLLAGLGFVVFTLHSLWRDAAKPNGRERFAFAVLALYGMISCASLLGTYANAYIQPLLRCDILLGAILLDRWIPAYDAKRGRRAMLGVSGSIVITSALAIMMMLTIVTRTVNTIVATFPHFFMAHIVHHEGPVYSGIWPETIIGGQAILDAHRDKDGKPPVLWSTYSGLLEARNGIFNPSTDYIIHALGPEARDKYLADFKRIRPQLVQTVSPLYTQYEAWIEETSWDFYAELLQHYDLIGGTPWSYFWARRDSAIAAPRLVWSAKIVKGADGIQLPEVPAFGSDSALVLYQVEIDYRTRNPLHSLPIVGSSPRYLIRAVNAIQHDPVTLNPYVTTTRFPLIATTGSKPVLQWAVYSLLPGATMEVTAIRLSLVRTTALSARWLFDLAAQQQGNLNQ